MTLPKILIGAPVRNRARWLPYYLDHLVRLDYDHSRIKYCFIVNDSEDNSLEILREFLADRPGEIFIWNLGQKPDNRNDSEYRKEIYTGLALLRNLLLDAAKRHKVDFLFSVDTDIMVPRDSLKKLVQNNKDICSALIFNDYHLNPKDWEFGRFPNIMVRDADGDYLHYRNYPQNQLFRVDVTGAVYLLSKKVFETVKYGYHNQGEDVAFCEDARKKGFEIYCDSRVFCEHIMTEEQLKELEEGQ